MRDFESLASEFATNVAAQTDAIARGDSKTGNRHAKRYIKAFEMLRAEGDRGRDALVPLLSHARADVRVMAATFLLRHRTEEARRVREEESRGAGLTAFGAGEALKRW